MFKQLKKFNKISLFFINSDFGGSEQSSSEKEPASMNQYMKSWSDLVAKYDKSVDPKLLAILELHKREKTNEFINGCNLLTKVAEV